MHIIEMIEWAIENAHDFEVHFFRDTATISFVADAWNKERVVTFLNVNNIEWRDSSFDTKVIVTHCQYKPPKTESEVE